MEVGYRQLLHNQEAKLYFSLIYILQDSMQPNQMQFAAYMTAETLREIREIIISVGFARMQPYGYCLCMERKTSSC